jgi:hypothetical protein
LGTLLWGEAGRKEAPQTRSTVVFPMLLLRLVFPAALASCWMTELFPEKINEELVEVRSIAADVLVICLRDLTLVELSQIAGGRGRGLCPRVPALGRILHGSLAGRRLWSRFY